MKHSIQFLVRYVELLRKILVAVIRKVKYLSNEMLLVLNYWIAALRQRVVV